ncbi:MAG: DNA repair protein RecO C-terminal domain-containing protein [Bacteroidales bacterium]|nr:DNA repair protein RecO C-terminal domain-containing protein [Bacteroidales bacterium]
MPLEQTRIAVLHITKYGDSGLILHCIDANAGRRSFFVRGVGKRQRIADFHYLALLDIVYIASPKSKIPVLKEYSPAVSLISIRSDAYKSAISIYISEVLYRSMVESYIDDSFFDWLSCTISLLEGMKAPFSNFHLWFLVGYAAKMGFAPKNDFTEICNRFHISTASFVGNKPEGLTSELFSAEDSLILKNMLSLPFDEAMKLPLSGKQRNAFCGRMLNYLSYHLGMKIELESSSVLHDILS